ncbi:hypothetical protein CABS01_01615 [Colletotrichum abscissum]|uniref:uncharacterized protein n=1 Tax=Colletotrichum abscissum TaxID=1671311 RepID=UPI0027D53E09|nr:uncharacterized protein CABS01_01615 [Colletotrichum abscissum]KAK1495808.1 hypothetical protein CABS01_01615 [Colletotrichum abscissum]
MKQDDFIFPSHSCLPTGFLPCLGTAALHIYEAATGGSFVRPPFSQTPLDISPFP